ncbi:hypothetical protein GOBAR_AA18490 [Gossypium barbadense]|uniref:Uncharacterized protein n=1 Tax=Gossypium barbadense TaxID=3634 RepID=A0A2P5XFU1_GOSBA|nr:hypothetical protein GOBAR_AA18490 [Gossypium barbadense]
MMNEILDLESWKVFSKGNDEIGGGYSGGGRGWVPQPQCPAKTVSWWSIGHGSLGEPFPVEFQVPKIQTMPVFIGLVGAHGRVARPCPALFASPTPVFGHSHVAWPWQCIKSHVGENFHSIFTWPSRTVLLAPVVWARLKARLCSEVAIRGSAASNSTLSPTLIPRPVAFILHRWVLCRYSNVAQVCSLNVFPAKKVSPHDQY